jgi:hypothetical protein
VPGYVETETLLDLAGAATADVRQRLALLLPAGVTSYDGDTVIATAGVTADRRGASPIAQPLVQQGLGPGLTADRRAATRST